MCLVRKENYIIALKQLVSIDFVLQTCFSQEILVCGHSLEVNMTTSLDFFLSVAQVQLLQQLIQTNMVGLEPSNKAAEVTSFFQSYYGSYTAIPPPPCTLQHVLAANVCYHFAATENVTSVLGSLHSIHSGTKPCDIFVVHISLVSLWCPDHLRGEGIPFLFFQLLSTVKLPKSH